MDYYFDEPSPREAKYNQPVADGLNQDPVVMSAVIRAGVNLRISLDPDKDDRDWHLSASGKVITKPLWDWSVAIAQSLLAIPIPDETA